MAKDDVIELEGIVTDALPNAMFKVKIGGEHILNSELRRELAAISQTINVSTKEGS